MTNTKIFFMVNLLVLTLSLVAAAYLDVGSDSDTQANVGGNLQIAVKSDTQAQVDDEDSNDSGDEESETILVIAGVDVKTNLEVSAGTIVKLSNGEEAQIKVTPTAAKEEAIVRARVNGCDDSNDCEIELKEVTYQSKLRAAYEVSAGKEYKLIGIFKSRAEVETTIDAETGTVISVDKPWWASISSEVRGSAASQINV